MFDVSIECISVQDFRSLKFLNLSFSKPINVIYGENNAGKTSLLEAIYICSNFKSFKSVSNTELINNSSKSFKISLKYSQNSLNYSIYLEKSLKSSKVLYNDKPTTKKAISLAFPCYSLVFGFNNILLNDSSYRRSFLDSGMFHVEPKSENHYKNFEKCLKQRNFLLKTNHSINNNNWDDQLVSTNNSLSEFRQNYFNHLNQEFIKIINDLKREIPEIYNDISSLSLDYFKGWDKLNFEETLKANINKDVRAGYTNSGTHRSDFYVYSHNKPVRESGSMSTLIIACLIINLARINVFHVKHGFKPTLLIDDLFFGIDKKNLAAVVKLLVYIKGNIVLTAPNLYIDILKQVCQESNDIEIINMEQKV